MKENRIIPRIGYMCATDYDHELGVAPWGNGVYPSIEDLRRCRHCVDECGIVKVEVVCVEIIQPSNFSTKE